MHEVVFLAGAEADLLKIYQTHFKSSNLEALAVAERIDWRLQQLSEFPFMAPLYADPFRRLVLGRHPYAIFYVADSKHVRIHAILHLQESLMMIQRRLQVD